MTSKTFWPLIPTIKKQNTSYDEAFDIAVKQAGSMSKLSADLNVHTNQYVSHQSLRNWRNSRNIPVHWALVFENYTDGKANLFDLVPWLLPRAVQYAQGIQPR